MNRTNWTRGAKKPEFKLSPGRTYICHKFWDRPYNGYSSGSDYRTLIANVDDEITIKKYYADDSTFNIRVKQKSIVVSPGTLYEKRYENITDFIVGLYDLKEHCL